MIASAGTIRSATETDQMDVPQNNQTGLNESQTENIFAFNIERRLPSLNDELVEHDTVSVDEDDNNKQNVETSTVQSKNRRAIMELSPVPTGFHSFVHTQSAHQGFSTRIGGLDGSALLCITNKNIFNNKK